MSNSIRAQTTFSFKGETHDLATTIDLDQCVGEPGSAPNFHLLLARAGGIDTHSYLYEVLEAQEVIFSDPTGIAEHCCCDGAFDWEWFEQLWRDEQEMVLLREIAGRTMGVRDLDAEAGLKAALLEAFRAGKGD